WGFGKVTLAGIDDLDVWTDVRSDIDPPRADNVVARNADNGVRVSWTSNELAAARLTWSDGVTTVMSYGLRGEILVNTGGARHAELELVDPTGNWAPAIGVTLPDGRGCGCHVGGATGADALPPLVMLVLWLWFRQTVGDGPRQKPRPVRPSERTG
ncbi:MAG: hypothetical protein D6761_11780, partial [Candidatus Dadabacteria bacterium]